jgi:hypothetical protein
MTMTITRLADATPFDPPGHRGVGPLRLRGGETSPTEGIVVTLSHYLPGGQAEMAPELVMISDGVVETLRTYDSVHFTVGTLRQVENRSHLPASMIVIRPAGA